MSNHDEPWEWQKRQKGDKLMEILNKIWHTELRPPGAHAQIIQYIEEIIGPDEVYNDTERGYAIAYGGEYPDRGKKFVRNNLRAAQRARLRGQL